MTIAAKEYFTSKEASKVTGIHLKKILNWDGKELIKPSHNGEYTFVDLILLNVAEIYSSQKYSLIPEELKQKIDSAEKLLFSVAEERPLIELNLLLGRAKILAHDGIISKPGYKKFKIKSLQKRIDEIYSGTTNRYPTMDNVVFVNDQFSK